MTLDAVSIGGRGASLNVELMSLTVVSGDASTGWTSAVASGVGGWSVEEEGTSWSLNGTVAGVAWSVDTPSALVRTFPAVSLQRAGDWLELRFSVRLTSAPAGDAGRLFWGLYDTHPEEGAIRYEPEFGDNGYTVESCDSEVSRRGQSLLELAVEQADETPPAANHVAVTPQLLAAAAQAMGGWARLVSRSMGASGKVAVASGYDAGGRLSGKRMGDYRWDFGYDTEGRLLRAELYWQPIGWEAAVLATEVHYQYDALGRRVRLQQGDWSAQVATGGQWSMSVAADLTYRFVFDGADVVAEYVDTDGDEAYDRTRIYWNEPTIDQKIGFVDLDEAGHATVYYYVTDQVGSILQVLDAQGQVVERYAYDAFGNLRDDRCIFRSGFDNRYRFHGREWDPFTGQYYYRYRQYDPDLGRFTNPDFNLDLNDRFGPCNYIFCSNNPLVYGDPMGLMDLFERTLRLLTDGLGVQAKFHAFLGNAAAKAHKAADIAQELAGDPAIGPGSMKQLVAVAAVFSYTEDVLGMSIAITDPVGLLIGTMDNYDGYRDEGINPLSAAGASTSLAPVLQVHDAVAGYSTGGIDMGADLCGVTRLSRGLTGLGGIALAFAGIDGKPVFNYSGLWKGLSGKLINSKTLAKGSGGGLTAKEVGEQLKASARNKVQAPEGGTSAASAATSTTNTTRTGVVRTSAADWRQIRNLWDELGYEEVLSEANRARIAAGRTPVVDDAWTIIHPEDAGLLGERISIHHIQGGPVKVPLPATRHLDAHMPGGFRYNPGGTGSQLPVYPATGGN